MLQHMNALLLRHSGVHTQ